MLGALGKDLAHITGEVLGLITLVGLVTITLSTYLILYAYPLYDQLSSFRWLFEKKNPFREVALGTTAKPVRGFDTIVFGLGRFGNHLSRVLRQRGLRGLAVGFDSEVVQRYRESGRSVVYGDAEDRMFASTLPFSDATWVISSVPQLAVNLALLHALSRDGYTGQIATTAHNDRHADKLKDAGSSLILMPFADAAKEAIDRLCDSELTERPGKSMEKLQVSNKVFDKILVSDFDGTMTLHDFYACAVKDLLSPEDLEPWHAYTRQEITHFEALRSIFERIRVSMPKMERLLAAMKFDSRAEIAVRRLQESGWGITVVSNGCEWYIDRFFRQHNLHLELHTNPGEYSPELGLQMRLPTSSPFFSPQFGISKSSVVRHALQTYGTVAFAGDGRPDLEPALMVQPDLRFAREWLASELKCRGEPFQEFSTWSEISERLTEAGA